MLPPPEVRDNWRRVRLGRIVRKVSDVEPCRRGPSEWRLDRWAYVAGGL